MDNLIVLKKFLSNQRLSVTEERLEIARTAIKFDSKSFCVDDIHSSLIQKGFNMAKSTVYRNLKLLRAAGLVEPAHKNRRNKDQYKNIIPKEVTCKICCLGCGYEEEIINQKFYDFVLDLCAQHDIEQFGVVVKIEGRKNCPWHIRDSF